MPRTSRAATELLRAAGRIMPARAALRRMPQANGLEKSKKVKEAKK